MQINRLLEIVYALLRQKTVTAKELAERFEVSQRTIYRDIDTLSLAGIPVYTEKGKGGGIGLLPEFVLDKSILSEQEQAEILIALQGLASTQIAEVSSPPGAQPAPGQVLKKLTSLFNKRSVNWLEVDFSGWGGPYGGDIFDGFKTAILDHRLVEFDYFSTYGEKTRRRAEPLQLWFKSRAWYVRAFCLLRQDVRLFKLTRVKNLTVTREVFAERNLLETCDTSAANQHDRTDVTLIIKIAPEMTYRVYDEFDDEHIRKNDDGSFTVTVIWPEDDWVYGFILSFGEYVEVIEPEHVKKIIREKAARVAGKYS